MCNTHIVSNKFLALLLLFFHSAAQGWAAAGGEQTDAARSEAWRRYRLSAVNSIGDEAIAGIVDVERQQQFSIKEGDALPNGGVCVEIDSTSEKALFEWESEVIALTLKGVTNIPVAEVRSLQSRNSQHKEARPLITGKGVPIDRADRAVRSVRDRLQERGDYLNQKPPASLNEGPGVVGDEEYMKSTSDTGL